MKKCKQGYYYCHTDKKCKRIPTGYRVGLGGYLRKENGEEQGENDNADNTNGNGNGNGKSNGGSNGGGVSESIISEKRDGKSAKDKGYSLRDWFKGGGWKQTGGKYDGKPCAKQPGQTTKPYCRDADDRAAMSKDKRDKAAAKKRKEDPNPNRKGKAIMVTQNNSFEPEANIVEEEKKKKRDACYHKVKSRYSVWPSAYASGALVKCRKVGAANWGNKSEEMDYASFAAKAKETVRKNKEKTLKGDTKTKKEEWIVDNAAQYFFNEGINEEGLAIFIEELGVENFVEFVHDLAEDSELIEAYALTGKKKTPKRLPKGTQPAKTTKATIARGDRTIKAASPSGAFKKRPAAEKAVETAKEKQSEKKPVKSTLVKGVADTLARGALSAWQGHKAAMKKKKEGKSVATQVGAGLATAAGAMLKKGKKHLSDDYQYSDWRDDFKAMEYEFIDLIKPEPLVSEGAMPDPIDSKKHRDASRQSKINNMKRSDNPNEREVANKKLTPAAKVDTPLTPANKFKEFSKNTAPKEKPRGPKLMGEGKYSSSVRATYGGKTETFPVEVYKKKSKEKEVKVDEKYQGMYQSPAPTYNRLMSSDEKARMSPGLRAMRRSDELERSELGSKRQKKQKKASMQMARNFQSARATKEEVEEGYRVISTSFKSGDGDPKDDVTIKKQKKVVSGDNLTRKGAERSANARRQEYGAGDAFQVQKTKTAKKRSSNAASEAEVKAKIDAKEKKQQKSRAQQSIAGMNRAGTPSGKVAAARLKTDKKFNKEEVDKRRAPSELVARLSAKREGHMAQDGPNKPAYDAKQRILAKTKAKRMGEEVETIDEAGKKCWKGYKKAGTQKLFGKTYNRCVKANEEIETVDEANRLEKHLGMGSNTPENELSRMKRRASASGIGSEGPDGKPRQNTNPGTIRMNRGVARMVHKRNRGKSPSDPTYKKRRGIDPHADTKSYRDSPLGLPKGYKDPLNPKSNIGNKVNSKVKIKERKPKQGSNKIVKFNREDLDLYDIILSHLLDEGIRGDDSPTNAQITKQGAERENAVVKLMRDKAMQNRFDAAIDKKIKKEKEDRARRYGNKIDEERSARRAKNPRKYADVKKEIDNKEFRAGKLTAAQKHEIEKKNLSKYTNFSGKRMTGSGGHGSENRVNPRISYIRNQYEIESDWRSEIEEGAAWTKKSGKNPSGGLNEKGRKSYERENPGSDLKRPSKKKGNKRRKSFCARMKGMKKKLTSSKTANDPDSRINKSLRAWNC